MNDGNERGSTVVSLNCICDIVKRFMSTYIRNSVGYMLTGSYATNQANETSDIDVLVVSRYARSIFVESYYFEGYKIQIIALPLLDIDYIIYRDVIIRKGVYLHQLATGIILNDEGRIIKRLKKKCSIIYRRGPHKLSESEINNLRGKITTRLEDLKGNSNPDEVYYIAIELYQLLIEAYFKINQKWIFSGKSAGRILSHEALDFHNMLKNAYAEVGYNNKTTLVKLTESVLDSIGGELHFTSTSACSSKVIGDYLTIFIPTNCSRLSLHTTSALCSQFIHVMNKLAPKYVWVKLNWFYGQSNQPGFFLITHSVNKELNEELLPKIDMFVKNLDKTTLSLQASAVEYPYLYSPLDGVKSENIKLLLFKLLSYLQNSHCNITHSAISYQLVNFMWKKLISEFKEHAPKIWENVIDRFSQNVNLYKSVYNDIMGKNAEISGVCSDICGQRLPKMVEKYMDGLMSACLNSEASILLSTPDAQTQFLCKTLQLIDSISSDININEIIKDIVQSHD